MKGHPETDSKDWLDVWPDMDACMRSEGNLQDESLILGALGRIGHQDLRKLSLDSYSLSSCPEGVMLPRRPATPMHILSSPPDDPRTQRPVEASAGSGFQDSSPIPVWRMTHGDPTDFTAF